jgi:hypothetical protein
MTRLPSPAGDSPHTWRQALEADVHDAREKALRHHRFYQIERDQFISNSFSVDEDGRI